ncbi:hypothetical protein BREVNS_0560 [Brevinematales bacterium NS]|nr:hypothetical protein BREVNS_0560 [Brevinematales bacterium NS]
MRMIESTFCGPTQMECFMVGLRPFSSASEEKRSLPPNL